SSGNCNGIQRFLSPTTTNCSTATHMSGIAIRGSSGLVWFDNSLTAQIGSFDPSNNTFAMSSLSNCGAHPHDGLNLDGAGNVWFDEEFANAIGELIPPAPATVKTEAASSVAQTQATLNATVNPNGSEVTECKLEYSTTTAYGSSAPCAPAPGSGSSAVSVSAAITTLTANTTYHFRISATNAGGTSTGADQTLKTLPNAPTVKTEPASAVSQTSATRTAAHTSELHTPSNCECRLVIANTYGQTAPCAQTVGSGGS